MSNSNDAAGFFTLIILILLVIAAFIFGTPAYKRYQRIQDAKNEKEAKELDGQARLAEAEQTRQITIAEAKAAKEAAKFLSEAEVERAKGVKESIDIIAQGLGGSEGYLRYLWIQSLSQGNSEVIYIPTEAGLPLLEAGKRK